MAIPAVALSAMVIFWSNAERLPTPTPRAFTEASPPVDVDALPRASLDSASAGALPEVIDSSAAVAGAPKAPGEWVLGRDLYVPRQASHLAAIENIKRYFHDPAKGDAYIKLLDENCALQQGHELEDASLRSELFEAIATRQPATAAIDLSAHTEEYLAKLTAGIKREMAFIPEGPEREPFRSKEFQKLLVDQCPSIVAEP